MNTAFIGLDYIVEITHPDGKLAASASQVRERGVIAGANKALQIARLDGWLSILVKVGYAPGYVDHPDQSPMFRRAKEFGALAFGSQGVAFHPDLHSELSDLVIVKPRVSDFYGTNLDAALRARRIERLVVAGVSTTWAVESTVRDAHDRDYEVLVLEEACAASTAEEHGHSINNLSRIARIVSVADLEQLPA